MGIATALRRLVLGEATPANLLKTGTAGAHAAAVCRPDSPPPIVPPPQTRTTEGFQAHPASPQHPVSQQVDGQKTTSKPYDWFVASKALVDKGMQSVASAIGAHPSAEGRYDINAAIMSEGSQPDLCEGIPQQLCDYPRVEPAVCRNNGMFLMGMGMIPYAAVSAINIAIDNRLLEQLNGTADPDIVEQKRIIELDKLAMKVMLADTLWCVGAYTLASTGVVPRIAALALILGRLGYIAGSGLMLKRAMLVSQREDKKLNKTHKTYTSAVLTFRHDIAYFGATILLNLYFVGKALSQNVLQTSNDILAGSTGMPSWFLAG
ncbi:MAG: hypothetical protein HQM16_08850, partial [Deltaproteobacteria bacterium]|nr:hypothetical protein [Deltaproteobacteria bacterium]